MFKKSCRSNLVLIGCITVYLKWTSDYNFSSSFLAVHVTPYFLAVHVTSVFNDGFLLHTLQNQRPDLACIYLDLAVQYNPRDPEILVIRWGYNNVTVYERTCFLLLKTFSHRKVQPVRWLYHKNVIKIIEFLFNLEV